MISDLERVFFTENEILARVKELSAQIADDYRGKNPLFIGILKGSFMFMSDLMKYMNIYCNMDFMAISSYQNGTKSSGQVTIKKDVSYDLTDRHVIIVEDIVDSGVSLSYLKKYLEMRNPASISICTLLDKPARRKTDIVPDYVGFLCPDAFIVGYGLDYAEKYRNLPYIGVLKPEIYQA